MEQRMMENFRVIGRCAKTQTLSLEDELKLFDGVPYDIDFSQDYSTALFCDDVLSDAPPSQIIRAILRPPEVPALPTSTEQNYSTIDWEAIDKKMRREEKREKKWKKEHKNIKPKEATKNLDNLMKEWGI